MELCVLGCARGLVKCFMLLTTFTRQSQVFRGVEAQFDKNTLKVRFRAQFEVLSDLFQFLRTDEAALLVDYPLKEIKEVYVRDPCVSLWRMNPIPAVRGKRRLLVGGPRIRVGRNVLGRRLLRSGVSILLSKI